MTIFEAAILGIVQGLAEFLPISSSGHLELFQHIMGLSDNSASMMLLTVLLHVGTLVAVAVVFWNDWMDILRHLFKSKTLGLLFIASLPALFAALLLGDAMDSLFGSGFLGLAFLITALFLLLTEYIGKKMKNRTDLQDEVGVKHALCMGVMQAVAILPGVSRSGSTLLGGIFSGMKREKAAKFSFMMSAPAIAGALLLEGKDAIEEGWITELDLLPTLVGVLVAAVVGYLSIRFMLKLITKVSLNWFALYVAILGVLFLALQLFGFPGVTPFAPPADAADAAMLLTSLL